MHNGVELKRLEDSSVQKDQSYISISVFNLIKITSARCTSKNISIISTVFFKWKANLLPASIGKSTLLTIKKMMLFNGTISLRFLACGLSAKIKLLSTTKILLKQRKTLLNKVS